ncbi:hypothetical protein LOAG_00834 [Loa loa]|uniref:Uncharacterized protein n=1 Tax=Loa loa TaxID=7209 RepID=A0A1S0UAE5_LOALO|nr:hypothetical protein LOAG_00834 [Loa loa]EFO27655.1 hypothetical protein LOAG_00834 [Loa loa]
MSSYQDKAVKNNSSGHENARKIGWPQLMYLLVPPGMANSENGNEEISKRENDWHTYGIDEQFTKSKKLEQSLNLTATFNGREATIRQFNGTATRPLCVKHTVFYLIIHDVMRKIQHQETIS